MRHLKILFLMLSMLSFAGCEEIKLGEPFTCRVGDDIRYDPDILFSVNHVNDYRCPRDMMCFWAGDVDIQLRFTIPFTGDTTMTLNNPSKNPLQIGDYLIELQHVNPYPQSMNATTQKQYVIEMVITRN